MANFWLEPEIDGSDKTGDLRSSHLNGERVKALVVEFVKQLTFEDWMNAGHIVPKVYYGSQVDATPLNRPAMYYPEFWGYEVRGGWGYAKDTPCLVLHIEHFFRSRFYGIAYREIWLPIVTLVEILQKLYNSNVPEDVVMQWRVAAGLTYTKVEDHKRSFKCTLRNLGNATAAFKAGLNEKAELVNGKM